MVEINVNFLEFLDRYVRRWRSISTTAVNRRLRKFPTPLMSFHHRQGVWEGTSQLLDTTIDDPFFHTGDQVWTTVKDHFFATYCIELVPGEPLFGLGDLGIFPARVLRFQFNTGVVSPPVTIPEHVEMIEPDSSGRHGDDFQDVQQMIWFLFE